MKRYSAENGWYLDPDGGFVQYWELAAAEAEVARLREALEEVERIVFEDPYGYEVTKAKVRVAVWRART